MSPDRPLRSTAASPSPEVPRIHQADTTEDALRPTPHARKKGNDVHHHRRARRPASLGGQRLPSGDWIEITQDCVDLFAEATDDHQWIHVDVDRIRTESPFGGPITHGYLTLSLLSDMVARILDVRGARRL
ncbi:MaoC/PaaZ C-terminal domain-containing protein [Rhodococcus aetherivorans]|uniref:MaoC/PaaZ C-terminal domain-containing protein n=1 Tax=Rhodococcus aetherivorans TaxID=191292 RepID=UPI00367117B1